MNVTKAIGEGGVNVNMAQPSALWRAFPSLLRSPDGQAARRHNSSNNNNNNNAQGSSLFLSCLTSLLLTIQFSRSILKMTIGVRLDPARWSVLTGTGFMSAL